MVFLRGKGLDTQFLQVYDIVKHTSVGVERRESYAKTSRYGIGDHAGDLAGKQSSFHFGNQRKVGLEPPLECVSHTISDADLDDLAKFIEEKTGGA